MDRALSGGSFALGRGEVPRRSPTSKADIDFLSEVGTMGTFFWPLNSSNYPTA